MKTKEKTGEKLVEEGIGIVAQGLFRICEKEGKPKEAYDAAMSVVSVVRGFAFDFLRKAEGKAK